ncbi:sialic acid-binding Ig-like lectin 10 [Halichoeres trimaculatus]|uniref:sialic acid-binding Ig-like lectin 10 n=1 Tax=Halichoeres trimaculatus TaxID=147232 RepID=UPI003D9E3267
MFVFTGLTLLLSVGGRNADTGASLGKTTFCQGQFCITLSDGEIRAEAGLCVVIPCSFTISGKFRPQSIVWFKCDPTKPICDASDVIFGGNRENILTGFKDRVSLLEPNIGWRNCSIIINDLTASDSGAYQLRVNGFKMFRGRDNGYTFSSRATVTVEDLTQKPTVMIPPLTEGQQTTLSCTAPGLCSGSAPEITWTWGGKRGGSDIYISGNITDYMTQVLSPVSQRHTSTLTFNPSFTQHHDTDVTCRASFNNISTEETVTLKVHTHPKLLPSSKCRVHSDVLTCECISDGFPSPTIKWSLSTNHTKPFITTSLANHTVKSTLTLTLNDYSDKAVECVSINSAGEVKQSLTMFVIEYAEDRLGKKALLPWTVAALSLILNVILISVVFLRKTVDTNQEDRTYMSLQKTEQSPEYDVIRQPLN